MRKLQGHRESRSKVGPIPRIDDLFMRLADRQRFTKLDLSHAYQQFQLDPDSHKYVTINTHKGLFTYNRLLFGVASAPSIFQRVMESVLQGIPGGVCLHRGYFDQGSQ